mmetsp:Transcript_17204/g.28579  ORF Transcript_17204/g.28579 Transcript_17204/m.28579 type:complete len:111 (-) Transcript_17204:67-399(-)
MCYELQRPASTMLNALTLPGVENVHISSIHSVSYRRSVRQDDHWMIDLNGRRSLDETLEAEATAAALEDTLEANTTLATALAGMPEVYEMILDWHQNASPWDTVACNLDV